MDKIDRRCQRLSIMEQATGVEPATTAWEAVILPLNYACKLDLTLLYHQMMKNATVFL